MTLVIFDLDDTLLNGDSATLFCQFLVDKQLAAPSLMQGDEDFYLKYQDGSLCIASYVRFMLAPIDHLSQVEISVLLAEFVSDYIAPNIYPQAHELLEQLATQNERVLLISATVEFIVKAIAEHLGIDNVLAIELEAKTMATNGCFGYSGEIKGVASFREGKVTRLLQWLDNTDEGLIGASFYSDSYNDLALLQLVDNPITVNPDVSLREHAINKGWPIIDWRNN
ncbi:MAG: HAD family hydrolase [Oceanospirillaceae bacterium]|nr:HAD family hydrolase [Oceanospirillaceae bacterium]